MPGYEIKPQIHGCVEHSINILESWTNFRAT